MFIEIKELTKIYNNYIAVDKINFEIEKNIKEIKIFLI